MIALPNRPPVRFDIVVTDPDAEPSREFIAAAVAVIRAARRLRAERDASVEKSTNPPPTNKRPPVKQYV